MHQTDRDHPQAERLIPAALALLLLAVYLATSMMSFHSIDGEALFATARGLAGRGAFDSDILYWAREPMGRGSVVALGQDGHMYSVKDVGLPVLAAPLLWLARALGGSPMRAALLFSPLATALTAALLYQLAADMGYRRGSSVLAALLFGLGSMAWPYADTFYTQPLSAAGLALALLGTFRAHRDGSWRMAVLGGLGLGLSGANAMSTWISGPFYVFYLVRWSGLRRGTVLAAARQALPLAAAFCAAAFLILGGQLAYNSFRFGAPLDSGFNQLRPGSFALGGMPAALVGILFSSSRGLAWYAPFSWLIPFSLREALGDRRRRFTLLLLAQAASILLMYAVYEEWWGGLAWGPRFLVSLMPAFVLLSLPALDTVRRRRWPAFAAAALLLISLLIQGLAAVIDQIPLESEIFTLYKGLPFPLTLPAAAHLFWDSRWLPLGRLLDGLALDGARIGGLHPALDPPLLLLHAGSLLLGLFLLLRLRAGRAAAARLMVWLLAAALLAQMALLARPAAAADGQPAAMAQLTAALEQQAMGGSECVVTLLPARNLAWMDAYLGPLPDLGMAFESPLSPASQAALQRAAGRCRRLWLVSEQTAAGNRENGVELWLADNGFPGAEQWFDDLRLIPYSVSREAAELQPLGQAYPHGITLEAAGYRLIQDGAARWIDVDLRWQGEQPAPQNYAVFVHLLDQNGGLAAQHDGQPGGGYEPTDGWGGGRAVSDRHQLALPADLPAGEYTLAAGLYSWMDGSRLPLAAGGDAVILGTVRIGAPAP